VSPAPVLVVDDDPLNRIVLTRLLERDGHATRTAVDGHEALAVLAQQPFDAVLLDVVMPGLDGIGVLEAIRADGRLEELPVIMVSALDESAPIVRCLDSGAWDFVTKPFDPAVLRAKVNGCLTRRRARPTAAGAAAPEPIDRKSVV